MCTYKELEDRAAKKRAIIQKRLDKYEAIGTSEADATVGRIENKKAKFERALENAEHFDDVLEALETYLF